MKMEITQKKWNNLHKKLNEMQSQLGNLENLLEKQRPKKWLKFDECVPPSSVCKDVFSMLAGLNTYTGVLGKLADYYGCTPMQMLVDRSIDPKYKAVYRPNEEVAYSRETTIDAKSVLHEWFHHMVNLNVVLVNKRAEEHWADKYATIFLQRAGQ